jgi:hypothetical protein
VGGKGTGGEGGINREGGRSWDEGGGRRKQREGGSINRGRKEDGGGWMRSWDGTGKKKKS